MLRQRVLQEWNTYKTKLKKEREFLEFLATNSLVETVLPSFPLTVSFCRQRLNSWTSANYQAQISAHRMAITDQLNQEGISGPLSFLASAYLDKIDMFNSLVTG